MSKCLIVVNIPNEVRIDIDDYIVTEVRFKNTKSNLGMTTQLHPVGAYKVYKWDCRFDEILGVDDE